MRHVPNLLSIFRIAMVPVLGGLAWNGMGAAFLVALVVSLTSDVLDGWIARKSGGATPLGAKLDSWGDLATYVSLPLFAWWLWPEVLRAEAPFMVAGLLAYFAPIAAGLIRWRRITSYHTWAAKGTSVVMGAALLCLFAGGPAWPFQVAVVLLVLEALEELAITATLPRLHSDVPSLWHALRIRSSERPRPAQRIRFTPSRTSRPARFSAPRAAPRVAPGRSWL
jgi:CDP-diacylglycerol--glycerol-3-phosphate 3-phosphatidyltransferase